METFIKEQIIHLVKKILSYNSDIEQKDFESTFDVDPIDIDRVEYERILNESDHIYKYMYALDRLIHQLENEKI
tara:strand:- start:975 stop:1196 length:222 start_codon:yes stop_codon:yes gene_type:complete